MTITSVTKDIEEQKIEIIRKIRALDPRMNITQTNNTAGQVIEARSENENIPFIHLIVNEINSDLTLRIEVIGNITQYIVDEIVTYILKSFDLIYLELTDPKTGLIKFSLYKNSNLKSNLYPIYKTELFNFHYAREDGRLLLFFDQGNLWVPPKLSNILSLKKKTIVKPKTFITKKTIKKDVVEEEPKLVEKEIKTEELISKKTKFKEDLSQREKLIYNLVKSRKNKKVQSKGLRKDLPNMDQDTIRNVLRSLVSRGLLYVRSAWYIVKENPEEDTWDIFSDTPIDERLKSLSQKERKIYDILSKRTGKKAQARMLMKDTKMTKENLKKLLRNMVAKDLLYVYAAWYCIKE